MKDVDEADELAPSGASTFFAVFLPNGLLDAQ